MIRDEYRLVPNADDKDPCLAIEMVRHHYDDTREVATEHIPLAGEIVHLNGHGYCASVTRCRRLSTGRKVTWSEHLGEVFDNIETCRIAIENAFEPRDFLD
ncbi:MAG: hypothetical protein OXC93_05610 [Rhodospirillaceae bacterium]|nr:hypothetical protein [Rhodospirillaceae bacterium]